MPPTPEQPPQEPWNADSEFHLPENHWPLPELVHTKRPHESPSQRAFIAVAELAHFTRAGERLGLSQSSVSTLVRELEDNLGLRLVDRHTRMLRLTQAGAEVLPLARKALADLDRAFGSSQDLRSLGRGRVKVAAASLQAALLLPRVIKDFCAEFPGVRIEVMDVNEYEVIEKLRAGEVDFGLGSALSMQDIVARPLTTDTFVAVMPEDHPLAGQAEVTWRELAEIPLIGPPPGNAVREQLDICLLYTSPSPRDRTRSRMPSSACKKQNENHRRNTTLTNLQNNPTKQDKMFELLTISTW